MEFLGSLGIDVKLLLAQVVNFAILLWFLTKFLYKPIIKRIEQDEADLNEAQTEAKELQKQQELFKKEKAKEVVQAKKRSRKIIKEAEEIANQIKNKAKEESDKEKKAVIKQIKSRLAELKHEEKAKSKKN